MLSLEALLLMIASFFFPTMFSSATISGNELTLQLSKEKARVAYSATFEAAGMVKCAGTLTATGETKDTRLELNGAQLVIPDNRQVTIPMQRLQLDEKLRPTNKDLGIPWIDLFSNLASETVIFRSAEAKKYDFRWLKYHIKGASTYKGISGDTATVESEGTVDQGKARFKLHAVLRYPAAGGPPSGLDAELIDEQGHALKWSFKQP